MHGARGFTLVELITVIVIVGIVALIAAPRFFAQSEYDARRFHDMALSAVRYGQKVAIAQHRNVYVVATASSISLCFDAACTAFVPSPGDGGAYTVSAPSGVELDAGNLSFDSLGQPNPNPPASLSVRGDSVSRQIVVEKDTGYVHP